MPMIGRDGAGHQPDDQRRSGAVHEVGQHALPLVVRAQQQWAAALRWVVQTADHRIGADPDQNRAEQADQGDEHHDDGGDPESRRESHQRSPLSAARIRGSMKPVATSTSEVRDQHRDGDDQQDRRDHRIVVLADRAEQQRAQTGVGEHELGDQRADDHAADGQGQPGDLGQHGVAEDVADRGAVLDAEPSPVVDVVRSELVDGHRAHAHRLAADEHEHQRPERQPEVGDGVTQEGHREFRCQTEGVRPTHRAGCRAARRR